MSAASRDLRAVDAPLRAALYLRQSVTREDSISLELQETATRDYCARMGYDVVLVESDPGISGRTWARPAVQRVLAKVEAHQVDIIVLWKWSRLSRSRRDWAVAADRVETAGGRIESATETVDVTTSTGRLARGMLTEIAAFESERIGDVWKETHARRIRAGLPANGKPRFGYLYERVTGFMPDPLTSPVLIEAYERYVRGESIYSLVAWLNDGPTRPVGGYGIKSDGLWSDRTLRRILDSGFAAGLIRSNGDTLPGAHPPLIPAELWESYRAARERRRTYRRIERSEYLLSGLVRCACGSTMTAGQFGAQHTAKYRCKAAHEKRTHTGGYVTASFVETAVLDWLVDREVRVREEAETAAREPRPRAAADPTRALRAEMARIDASIDKLGLQLVESDMPRESYNRLIASLSERRRITDAAIRSAAVHARVQPVTILPDLITNWDRLPIPERREILRALMSKVIVTPGRPRAVVEVVARE